MVYLYKMESNKEKEELNHILPKVDLVNIKSYYIIQKVFNNMKKNKPLEIIKYNKKLQNKLNISINDYKKFFEQFTPIEIEIKPVKNKYGQFINIINNKKKYFHIYFDNKKKK